MLPEPDLYDVVILGGGINGCGTFRDLALQGLRVLLIEKGDFCQGASAASSRLMHGGLKYLETGEFRLVRESLAERNMLLATAPHYVKPLECVVPVRSVWGGIAGSVARFLGFKARLQDRGLVITALGLRVYDVFGRTLQVMPGHRMLRRQGLRALLPDLAPAISGAGVYFEGHITHAERLGLELVLDACAANSAAHAVNHAELVGADGGVIRWRDAAGTVQLAQAKVIVNAGGAWIDRINVILGLPTHLMGGSKGSHLVLDHPALAKALNGRMVYFGTPDGRVNLIYPFEDRVLVGATDIAQDDPDTAHCTATEEAYLCAAVAEVFPSIPVGPAHIVHRFCGVRPLPRAEGAVGGVTRDHSIVTLSLPGSDIPVHCLIGGKWTTFRAFAEIATDRVLADLGRPRRASTAGLAIGGGRDFPRDPATRRKLVIDLAHTGGITPARADLLLSRYGTRAREYVASLGGGGEVMLATLPDYAREEIRHIADHEHVGGVDDILCRRTLITLTGHNSPAVRAELERLLAPAVGDTATT